MAEGQRELLDRLRINRDEEEDESGGGKRWLIIGFMALCALLAAGAIYSFWPKGEEQVAAAEPSPAPGASAAPVASGGVLS